MTIEHDWIRPGDCISAGLTSQREVTLRCDVAEVRLHFCAPNVVRVWCDPAGRFERKYASFTVEREDLAPVEPHLAEDAASYVITAGALSVHVDKAPFRLTFFDAEGALLTRQVAGRALGWTDAGELGAWHEMAEDEAFWGLGEKRERFNKRGERIFNWGTDLYSPDELGPPADEGRWYGACTHVLSSRGYAILFDNTSRTCFDFGKGDPDELFFGALAPAAGGELIYYLIAGSSSKAIVKTYTDMAGKSFFPPLYALGNGQSWWGDDWYQDDIEACARTYREKGIPCDTMWACLEWYLGSFTPSAWNTETFPDPRGWVERLHAAGFHTALYDEPNIPRSSRDWEAGVEGGHFLKNADGEVVTVVWPWGGESGLVDLFGPDARAWWAGLHDHVADVGVDCFWIDMNEPAAYSTEWVFHNESGGAPGTIAEMHNVYALMHGRAMYEWYRRVYTGRRPFLLSRSYYPGSQRYAAVWSGDTHSKFEWLAFQPRMGLSMGLSGYALWAHDIGGYWFGNPDEELFKRWIEFAALCPLHRFHHHYPWPSPEEAGPEGRGAGPNFPWRYESEEVSRTYITLRQRLLPYMYSCIADAVLGTGMEPELGLGGTGMPLMRAMALEFPDDPATYDLDEQFMCGPFLLSAPVLERAARTKRVYLPAGAWYDYYTELVYKGPGEIVVEAPLDRLPLFVREGAIIPLWPAMQYVGERAADPLTLEVCPLTGETTSAFVLYEDDGKTLEYERGAWCKTHFQCLEKTDGHRRRVELQIGKRDQGDASFTPLPRSYEVRFHGCGAVEEVALDGVRLQRLADLEELKNRDDVWSFDHAAGVVTVRVADMGREQTISLA